MSSKSKVYKGALVLLKLSPQQIWTSSRQYFIQNSVFDLVKDLENLYWKAGMGPNMTRKYH